MSNNQGNVNAASLREAAEKLVKYLPKFLDAIHYYGVDGYYREPYERDLKELRGRMSFLEAALAEPARNCDRFRTEGEAYAEFGRAGNTFGADTAERLYRYVRWLFASAEGGAE